MSVKQQILLTLYQKEKQRHSSSFSEMSTFYLQTVTTSLRLIIFVALTYI
jgi:hypothetical protein